MDNSKCKQGEQCKFKWFCKRYTEPENERQVWSNMQDLSKSGKTCKNQIKVECPYCGQTKVHKMGCATRKTTINLK